MNEYYQRKNREYWAYYYKERRKIKDAENALLQKEMCLICGMNPSSEYLCNSCWDKAADWKNTCGMCNAIAMGEPGVCLTCYGSGVDLKRVREKLGFSLCNSSQN